MAIVIHSPRINEDGATSKDEVHEGHKEKTGIMILVPCPDLVFFVFFVIFVFFVFFVVDRFVCLTDS
jgi:hypothetical protein